MRAVVGVDVAAVGGAPAGVVNAVAALEAHPVIDRRGVIVAVENGVHRTGIHGVVALGRVVVALGAGDNRCVHDDLAVLDEPHALLRDVDLDIGGGRRDAVDLVGDGDELGVRGTGDGHAVLFIDGINAEIQLGAVGKARVGHKGVAGGAACGRVFDGVFVGGIIDVVAGRVLVLLPVQADSVELGAEIEVRRTQTAHAGEDRTGRMVPAGGVVDAKSHYLVGVDAAVRDVGVDITGHGAAVDQLDQLILVVGRGAGAEYLVAGRLFVAVP